MSSKCSPSDLESTMDQTAGDFSPSLSLQYSSPIVSGEYQGPPHILRLPTELLHNIFVRLEPADFLVCRQSCSRWLHATESRSLFAMYYPAPGPAQSLEDLKKIFFHRIIDRLSPLEKCRRGLGKFYRSTMEFHIRRRDSTPWPLTGEESPVFFLAEGDSTFFVIYVDSTVYIFNSLGYLRVGGNIASYLATQPAMEYSLPVKSPVVGFYASRGQKTGWGSNEKSLFLLTHKNDSATIITGTVGFKNFRHVSLKRPFATLTASKIPGRQPKIIAAAVDADNCHLAFLCEAGIIVYLLGGMKFNQTPLSTSPLQCIEDIWGATNILFAGRYGPPTFLSESQTVVLPCNDISSPTPQLIPTKLPPAILSPIPPKFMGNVGIESHSCHSNSMLHPCIVNNQGSLQIAGLYGSGDDGYLPSQGMFPLHGARLLHPHDGGAGKLVEYVSVRLDNNNYLIATRYVDGQIWLYEFNITHDKVTCIPQLDPDFSEMQGVLVGREEGVLRMGFAVRRVDEEKRGDWRTLVALVLVLEGLVVVTRQLSVVPKRKCGVFSIVESDGWSQIEKLTQGVSLVKIRRFYPR
ncbi:hypothetical protein K440DRAFT_252974 [Wilcoxina mikolae CBS 423.85]|nr:hypothetical protein K440DRAFT_252974 [Wilcoxina mikolae CBS 423.85]